jgi:type 1 glutamine amidotransferase
MDSDRPVRVLAVTGGHRVDLDSFTAMLSDICIDRSWAYAHAVQPAAQQWLTPAHRGIFGAILCHDLPGLCLKRGNAPHPVGPHPSVAQDLHDLLDAGQGIVFLHHALAGWPGWPDWAEVLGGRYHYAQAQLRGVSWPDSGFRYTDYTARVLDREHPVCAGIDDFTLHDELYCCPVFEADVMPLLRADAPAGDFRETYHEVLGTPRGGAPWSHPPASDLIAWATSAGSSPIVYIQPGDGSSTFADQTFRRLVGNALEWVASTRAREWATARSAPAPTP